MNLTTYRAYTMAEALAAVKRDLGEHATIVHTRSFRKGGVFGLGRRTVVEVTATPGDQPPRAPVARTSKVAPDRRRAEAKKAYAGAGRPLTAEPTAERKAAIEKIASQRLRKRPDPVPVPTQQSEHASARQRCLVIRQSEKPTSPAPVKEEKAPPIALAEGKATASEPVSSVARRFVLQQPQVGSIAVESAPAKRSTAAAISDDESTGAKEELHAIKGMVSQILQRQTRHGGGATQHALPQQLFEMYLKLVGQELSEELADRMMEQLRAELKPHEVEDESCVRRAVCERLAAMIPAADEPIASTPRDGRPLTIALIGPTGVGKTTTLAKLAATYKLQHKQRVGLVTSDTYRIAAVEQLRTYANIIGLPLNVVLTPTEMRRACETLRNCDVVLIDTAGRSQRDSSKLDELRSFLEAADPHEVHLVLASTASERVLLEEADAFSAVRADKVIFTKLDEAVSFGILVNVARKIGKQLSFVTTGQEVPDHIEPGRPERLAELMLGGGVPSD